MLAGGLKVCDLFDLVASVRSQVEVALIAMVSFSIVRRMGVAAFARRAARSGFDGLIVPDVPYEEAAEVTDAAGGNGLGHVLLVARTTPPCRAEEIARRSGGFVYLVAGRGPTGERDQLPDDLRARVAHLRAVATRPVCVGFGISNAAQVRQVCALADGAIIGSAIVRRITEALEAGEPHSTIVARIERFVEELIEGVW